LPNRDRGHKGQKNAALTRPGRSEGARRRNRSTRLTFLFCGACNRRQQFSADLTLVSTPPALAHIAGFPRGPRGKSGGREKYPSGGAYKKRLKRSSGPKTLLLAQELLVAKKSKFFAKPLCGLNPMLFTYVLFSEIEADSSSPRRGEPKLAQGGSPGERSSFMTIAPRRGAAKLSASIRRCLSSPSRDGVSVLSEHHCGLNRISHKAHQQICSAGLLAGAPTDRSLSVGWLTGCSGGLPTHAGRSLLFQGVCAPQT